MFAAMKPFALPLGAALIAALATTAPNAEAFCRLTTCNPDEPGAMCQTDASGCITQGDPLFYSTGCISFAVARGDAKALNLTDEEFHDVVLEAFASWQGVDCGGNQPPGFTVSSAGIVDSKGKFFCKDNPELNVGVWGLLSEWPHSQTSLGFTTSTFETKHGEVFDADVELNLGKIVNSSFPIAAMRQVVLSIVTHEAGHVLGLAHSDGLDAVMAASYNPSDLLDRPLTPDDVAGICAIFPPGGGPEACPVPGVSDAALNAGACAESALPPEESSCSVGPRAPGGAERSAGYKGLIALTLIGAALARRSQRRTACPQGKARA
ncbi:MAG: hypothetical protein RJA70_3915 [Pseudomonadota bacterium]|jgi:hypothetical protein